MAAPAEPEDPARTGLRRFDDLPGPRGLPVFGNLLQIDSTQLHLQFESWCRKYGPIFRLRLGAGRIVVIGDHELVAKLLRDRPDGFRRTARFEQVWTELGLKTGVFSANGDTWRRQRRMVMAGFDPGSVRRYHPALQRVALRLAGRWQRAARSGNTIDLQADLMRYTVDAIAGLAFGTEVNTLESDEDVIQKHLNRLFPMAFKRLFSPIPLWRWFPGPDDRKLATSVAEIDAAVDGFIVAARARLRADPALRERPSNLLEAMLVAADEPQSGMDDRQVAGNVLTMLLAGEDTTANTLAWMIHLLWQNPQALAKATAEVREVCPAGAIPSVEQVARLEYVEACAHETMRLKPVAPQNGMQALRDTVLGDVQIETGMVVIAMMRRDSVSDSHVPDAADYRPERWLSESDPARRISMPFGAGPRICPGRYLALVEMKVAMATLLGRFDIELVGTIDGKPPRELLQLAMAPVGLTMKLRPRAAVSATDG